jgi:YD repeat-containing protein
LIQSVRLSSEDNIKDTTEIYTYHYDSSQKLISESYYHKKDFGNRTEYFYNTNGHVVEERFYEGEEFELDVLTKYKYTPEGMLSKKIQRDFRVNRKGKKDLFRYEVRYW